MADCQYFGTDGVRGEVGKFPIIPEFIEKLAWAAGNVLGHSVASAGLHEHAMVLGHDGRESHLPLKAAIIKGLHAAGVAVIDCGFCPTPAVAYLTPYFQAQAGIVISASHNPAKDNGIKFFNHLGGKLTQVQELAIEKMLAKIQQQTHDYPTISKTSHTTHVTVKSDALTHYQQFCLQSVAGHLDLSGWKIVVDCANGAMSSVAPNVLQQLGAQVQAIFCSPNGININDGCGATALAALSRTVLETHAQLGIAFDGDGDRVMMVDSQGKSIDGDGMLYLIAKDWQQHHQLDGGVVGTVMSSMALEQQLLALGIAFTRTQVGDIWVLAECHARDWPLGGEPSGHIICLNKATTGDGLVAVLQVLAALQRGGVEITQALRDYQPYPHILLNVKVNQPKELVKSPKLQLALAQAEQKLGNMGRILVRPSGTEPLIRIMVEGKDADTNQQIAQSLAGVVEGVANISQPPV